MKHAVQLGRGFRNLAALGVVATLLFGFAASGDAKTWTVTTTADSATDTGSIRYILSKAGKGDTIKFTSGGATLTEYLTLDKKLTIEGPATIRQSGGQRILYIPEGGNVTLNKLTLSGGGRAMDLGGAIRNLGSLKMEDCTVSGNSSVYEGGGVINRGKLEIDGGKIRNNSCGSGGSSALSTPAARPRKSGIARSRTTPAAAAPEESRTRGRSK